MPAFGEIAQSEDNTNDLLKFLLYGYPGCGKTTLFRTLPGKKFIYMFDPAGLNAFDASSTDKDINVETFFPDTISMSVVTIKGQSDAGAQYQRVESYKRWEKDFVTRINTNWFRENGYHVIGFDSLSTFADLILDQILQAGNRLSGNIEISDYGIQARTIARIVRNATSQGCVVFFTAHEEAEQDKLLKTVSKKILLPGKLPNKLPSLFSDIYHVYADSEAGKAKFFIETVPSRMYPAIRCSLHVPGLIDVTLPEKCPDPTKYGLGKILREKGRWSDELNKYTRK